MDFSLSPSYDPYPLLFYLARHNFDFLRGTKQEVFARAAPLLDAPLAPLGAATFVRHHFILDASCRIKSVTSASDFLLGHPAALLSGSPFAVLLGAESLPLWYAAKPHFNAGKPYHFSFLLTFVTSNLELVPGCCCIASLHPTSKLLVDAFLFPYLGLQGPPASYSRSAVLAQRVHAYLLSHLDTQLPATNKLAGRFGTNEFLLKSGFKYYYGTSIYHFHKELRLERAHALIQEKDLRLSEIAAACGFGNYPNFSKAFKKRFGHSPREASST